MHLKRYRSNSVRDALAQARLDLGSDALVLSTRLVGDRGWGGWMGQRVVELTAASTRAMSETRPERPSTRQSARVSGPVEKDVQPTIAPAAVEDPIVARLCATGLDKRTAADVAASFLGTGQRVPEDLARATAERLAEHVLGEHATPDGDLA